MRLSIFIVISVITSTNCFMFNCSTKGTKYIRLNQIVFFETPNYPKLLKDKEFGKCQRMEFVLEKNETVPRTRMFYAFMEIAYAGDEDALNSDYGVISSSTDDIYQTYFEMESYFEEDYVAQQGYLIFDDFKYECPLESISREQPFKFSNENQVLRIFSTFDEGLFRANPCKWQFTSPKGYSFKIVIEALNISSNTQIFLKNSTDIIFNQRSARLLHPYYNSDNYIQIYLSTGNLSFLPEMEFQAYISIFKNDLKNLSDHNDCTTRQEVDGIAWTNINKGHDGYKPNSYCQYNLIIQPNTEIYVNLFLVYLEPNADFIRYHNSNESSIDFSTDKITFMIAPYYDGRNRSVSFEFFSDSTIQSLGFLIHFSSLTCKCNPSKLKCDGYQYNVIEDSNYLCGNFYCKIHIMPFKSNLSLLAISYENIKSTDNVITISSNNIIIFQTRYFNLSEWDYHVYLNSQNDNFIEINTTFSSEPISFNFRLFNAKSPRVDKRFTLSPNTSSHIIDMGSIDLAVVKLEGFSENVNGFLMYSSYDTAFQPNLFFYNNESFTYELIGKECFGIARGYKCIIKEKEFAIFMKGDNVTTFPIFVVRPLGYKKGCVFEETIYISKNVSLFTFTNMATSEDECIITILIDLRLNYYISNMWTKSKENIQVFIGTDRKNLFFEFNSITAKQWTNIALFSSVYSIKIPKNQILFMQLTSYIYQVVRKVRSALLFFAIFLFFELNS